MPSFRPADLSLPCSPSCVGPNGLTERLTQGRLAPRPSQGMLNNPFRYLRRKWKSNRPTTTCIVFGTACFACRVAAAYAVRPMRNRIPRASPRRVPGRNPRPAIGSAPSRHCGSALPCDPSLAGVYPFPVKIASGLRSCPPRHLVAEHNITNTIPLNSQRNRLPLNSLRRRVPTSDSRSRFRPKQSSTFKFIGNSRLMIWDKPRSDTDSLEKAIACRPPDGQLHLCDQRSQRVANQIARKNAVGSQLSFPPP